jgi:hypothetical protein
LRTFSRIALASAGISKSIDIWFPRFLLLLVGLGEWHKPANCQRQRQTKFEAAMTVIPREGGVSSTLRLPLLNRDAGVYWIIRPRG